MLCVCGNSNSHYWISLKKRAIGSNTITVPWSWISAYEPDLEPQKVFESLVQNPIMYHDYYDLKDVMFVNDLLCTHRIHYFGRLIYSLQFKFWNLFSFVILHRFFIIYPFCGEKAPFQCMLTYWKPCFNLSYVLYEVQITLSDHKKIIISVRWKYLFWVGLL